MTERFRAMGCDVVVSSRADSGRVRQLFYEDDRRFTRFAGRSELQRVNRASGPVLVSARFARALRAAMTAWRQTAGLVDPTLLGALECAGYDRDFAELEPDARPAASGEPGRASEVRLTGRLLSKPDRLKLDLNGVVKAMAVDDALAVGGAGGWVSAGGDLATSRPLEVALPAGGSVRLQRGALATSGSATRQWLRGGARQHHLIDPRNGRPAVSPWAQVTVCGATCLMADVAAKAAFLMAEAGPSWLDERGMPGRFVGADGSVVLNRAWARTCT